MLGLYFFLLVPADVGDMAALRAGRVQTALLAAAAAARTRMSTRQFLAARRSAVLQDYLRVYRIVFN